MRPYAFWLLLSGVLVLAVLDKARPWVIGVLALLAGGVATGSIGLLLGLGFWILWTRGWRVSLALAPGLLVALYYALLSGACVNRAQAMQGMFSLWVHPALLRVVPRVLIGPAEPVNLAMLAAFAAAIVWARRPLAHFWALAVIFATFSVVTTVAIFWRDYFFDARLFIPLLFARGLLMGAGFSLAWARWPPSALRARMSPDHHR
jgi:hypothetical protein